MSCIKHKFKESIAEDSRCSRTTLENCIMNSFHEREVKLYISLKVILGPCYCDVDYIVILNLYCSVYLEICYPPTMASFFLVS